MGRPSPGRAGGRAGVDLGEEQGEGAGDAGLAGPVQRHGDVPGRVGDGSAEPADDRLAGDGPVLVVVLEVGVKVPGEVVLGVGGQQARGSSTLFLAAAVMVRSASSFASAISAAASAVFAAVSAFLAVA